MIWLAAALAQLLATDLPPRRAPSGPFQTLKSGLYETIAPTSGLPAGPLDKPPSGVLPEWLEVTVTAPDRVAIVFQPDGRVRWEMSVGPYGPTAKTTFVDGLAFLTSTFDYAGTGGCPLEKRVSGPGLAQDLVQTYRCDAAGRIVARGDDELIERPAKGPGYTVRHREGGTTLWSEQRFDDGRLERAWIGANESESTLAFAITRRANGGPRALERRIGQTRQAVPSGNPADPRVTTREVSAMHAPMSRGLVHAFLGAPSDTIDHGQGAERTVRDDFAPTCWLNQTSTLAFDASLMVVGAEAGCICGLCIADDVPLAGEGILGVDTHVRNGPWVALDGIVVTADHAVLTPFGAIPAGWLHVGSVVVGHDGPRALISVERLPDGPRRGRNLLTTSGVFEAGEIVFLSEESFACSARSFLGDATDAVPSLRTSTHPSGVLPAFVP